MRDKERLELLENGSSFSSDDITFLLKQARLYQISRDDTRKACHKVREENKKLEQQNKHYREAIERLISEWKGNAKATKRYNKSDYSSYRTGLIDELEQVLEGEE